MQRCPKCEEAILAESINVQEGVALCPVCQQLTRLSELILSDRSAEQIVSRPPYGCSIQESDQEVVVTASLQSVGGAIAAGIFALFWNGIVSIFVLIAIAGLYANLIGPLPDWFPAPDVKDGKPRMNDGPMELGMTLFLCLFLCPFLLVGIGSLATSFIFLFGKVRVSIGELDSYTSTGIGPFRWRKRFDATQVQSVSYQQANQNSDDGKSSRKLVLMTDRSIDVTSLLPDERMEWLRVVLKELLLNPNDSRYGDSIPYLAWLDERRAPRSDRS